jgi:hypothetical protein
MIKNLVSGTCFFTATGIETSLDAARTSACGTVTTRNLGFVVLFFFVAALVQAQEGGDADLRTRQLWDTTLLNKRPASTKPAAVKRPSATPVTGALIGVTVWRLRPSKSGDARAVRSMIHERRGG